VGSEDGFGEVLARVLRFREDPAGRDAAEAQADCEALLDALRDVTLATQGGELVEDPRLLGGAMAGPGGPFDHGGTVLDASRAILVDSQEVCKVDRERGARGQEMFAFLFEGRINQSPDRARVMLFGDVDFMAAVITECHGVAERAGADCQRRLHERCAERWADMPHPPG
jgi:hypothetical protein